MLVESPSFKVFENSKAASDLILTTMLARSNWIAPKLAKALVTLLCHWLPIQSLDC